MAGEARGLGRIYPCQRRNEARQCAFERRFVPERGVRRKDQLRECRCMCTLLPERPHPCRTHSRSRGLAKLDYRQVSPAGHIAHDKRQLRSALGLDRRLRQDTRPGGWPVPAWFKSRPGVRRSKIRVDLPRCPSAERLMGTVHVVPHGVRAELTPHHPKPQRN